MQLNNLSKNSWLIIYKLLADCLFLLLLFFALALIADGLIPGIVTDHFSFLKIILVIGANLALLAWSGHVAGVEPSSQSSLSNKKTAFFLAILAIVLIFNSMWKLNLYLAIFILVFVLITFYFLYRNTFGK